MKNPPISKVLLICVGIATFLGLIVWSGLGVISKAFNAVSRITPSSWILLLFLMASMMIFHGLRWFFLLTGANEKIKVRDVYPILFFSYFVNQFMPFRPGSPMRSVLGAKKLVIPFSLSLLAIIIEEVLDVLVTGTLALQSISILSPNGALSDTRVIVALILSAIFLLFILIIWWDNFLQVITKILLRVLPKDLRTQIINSNFSSVKSITQWRYLVGSFLLTIAYWTVRFEFFIRILKLVNISIGFVTAATIISLSFLVSVLTMVPGGWGVKELTITMMLIGLGIDEQVATAAAFLDRAVLLVFILILGSISSFILGTDIRPKMQVNQKNNDIHLETDVMSSGDHKEELH
ncbi:MAG: YbhN family protein [Candidatus Hodarchaeota archaeon]